MFRKLSTLTVPASSALDTLMHWLASSAAGEIKVSNSDLDGHARATDRRTAPERGKPKGNNVLECRPAPKPYVVLFASLIASSSVLNLPTERTGPKISSWTCADVASLVSALAHGPQLSGHIRSSCPR